MFCKVGAFGQLGLCVPKVFERDAFVNEAGRSGSLCLVSPLASQALEAAWRATCLEFVHRFHSLGPRLGEHPTVLGVREPA